MSYQKASFLVIHLVIINTVSYCQKLSPKVHQVTIEKVIPYKGMINGKAGYLEFHYTYKDQTSFANTISSHLQFYKTKLKDLGKIEGDIDPYGTSKSGISIPNDSLILSSTPFIGFKNGKIYPYSQATTSPKLPVLRSLIKNRSIFLKVTMLSSDTIAINPFTGDSVQMSNIASLNVNYVDNSTQTIKVNEVASFETFEGEKVGDVRLEDFNNDGYLDLWIAYLSGSRQYDSDFVIFLYNPKTKKFGSKKYYELKNIPDDILRKRWNN